MSQTSYDNVPLYTGIPVPQGNNGFFQPPAPSAEGILATDQARAVAEVQAALVIAASRPRNELRARDRLCKPASASILLQGRCTSTHAAEHPSPAPPSALPRRLPEPGET